MKLSAATFSLTSASFFLASNSFSSVAASPAFRAIDEDFGVEEVDVLTEEKSGTFLVAIVDYEDGAEDRQTLNIMIDEMIYELDDVEDNLETTKGLKSGQTVTLPAGAELGAKSGKAKVNGGKIKAARDDDDGKKKKSKRDSLFERNLVNGRTEQQQRNVDQLHRHLYSTTFGDKKTVAVRVQAADNVYTGSEDDLRREVFGLNPNGSIGDTFNLSSGYDQCSYGELTFSPLNSEDGIDNGVVTITVDVNAAGNSDATIRNAVTAKIRETFGNDMTSVADYWLYCLPPGTNGNWIAYAYIDSYISVYNNQWCNYPSAQIHEVGHNLNFAHSGEGSNEYADQSGMMGFSYSQDEGPVMCFNSAKSWQTGWYGQSGAYGDKTMEISSADGCIETSLSGIADYETTTNPVLIKVLNPVNSGNDYFVAFNGAKGINSGTREAGDQVTVVQVDNYGGTDYAKSWLRAKLNGGGSYTIDDLTVEVDSITGSDVANVKIYFGGSCGPATPPPSPAPTTAMPTNEGNNGPQTAIYDASYGAPRCSFGSSCDSDDLLDSRGSMAVSEPNRPNTLNSCTDGNGGTYHSDESIDKVVVSQPASNPNDMTEGDTVTITATVWCWNNGASDYIDFYYASDASNPDWTQIGERKPCPGGGAQTVTAEYALPEGQIQAVRVNLMYNSNPASADSCTTGTYDDTDDLVFSVKAASQPTDPPSPPPTSPPTSSPTASLVPTQNPTDPPTQKPTPAPSNAPTQKPTTAQPTQNPTASPSSSPSQSPTTAQPTQNPTASPSSSPSKAPSSSPTSSPSQSPTNQPTTASPSKSPTAVPTEAPTTASPSKSPTAAPSSSPSSSPSKSPTNEPTTSNPTSSPTSSPTKAPITSSPTKAPVVQTNPPSASPSASPTASPSSAPTSNPTEAPTSSPSKAPTGQPVSAPPTTSVMSKSLVCGRGDIPSKPCEEGLEGTDLITETHEVRCCRDCEGLNCKKPWKRKCTDFDPNLFARSKYAGECKEGTFAEAIDFCRNIPGQNTRLCTPEEVKNSCTKGTGCQFDKEQIWACAYDGHTCNSDEECCGTCNASGVCEGEYTLFP